METILFDGEFLELPEKQKLPPTRDDLELAEGIGEPSNPLINTKEATDFINAFLYTGGEIKNSSCQFSHHLEGCVLWLKNCFEFWGIIGSVKNIFKGRAGRPAVWIFESNPYIELAQIEENWFYEYHGKIRRKVVVFENTPLTLLFWFLWKGRYYEYTQFKSNEHPHFLSKGLSIDRSEKIAEILGSIGVNYFIKGTSGFCIKEPDYKNSSPTFAKYPSLSPNVFTTNFPMSSSNTTKNGY